MRNKCGKAKPRPGPQRWMSFDSGLFPASDHGGKPMDCSEPDHAPCFLAGAVAEVGEEFDEFHCKANDQKPGKGASEENEWRPGGCGVSPQSRPAARRVSHEVRGLTGAWSPLRLTEKYANRDHSAANASVFGGCVLIAP